jgi:uncharacterized protein (DUF1015 family)
LARISPFRGIFYNQKKISNLNSVITPPYDVIDSKGQEEFYNRSPYNSIRLSLGKRLPSDNLDNNNYTRAKDFFEKWQEEEILFQDKESSLYFSRQIFNLPGGEKKVRKGFVALVCLEEFEKGIIIPHERTLHHPKIDRFNLIKSCKANFCPIIGIYSDPDYRIDLIVQEVFKRQPSIEFTDDQGIINQIWKVVEKSLIKEVMQEMEDKVLYIADGHHRYETAISFRDSIYKKYPDLKNLHDKYSFDKVMFYLTNLDDPGLLILSVPRLVYNLPYFDFTLFFKELNKYFYIESISFNGKNEPQARKIFLQKLNAYEKENHVFGIYVNGVQKYFLLILKDKDFLNNISKDIHPRLRTLNVNILEQIVFLRILGISKEDVAAQSKIFYLHDNQLAIEKTDKENYKIAFLLNPVKISDLREICNLGERMPQKSTYFFPKFLSSLIINKINLPE